MNYFLKNTYSATIEHVIIINSKLILSNEILNLNPII